MSRAAAASATLNVFCRLFSKSIDCSLLNSKARRRGVDSHRWFNVVMLLVCEGCGVALLLPLGGIATEGVGLRQVRAAR